MCAIDRLPLLGTRCGGDEVHEREHDDPDEVDEVPEEAGDLDVVVLAALELAEERTDEGHRQKDDAGEHVATVKARDEVERARIRRVPKDESFVDETGSADAEVLLVLTGQEQHATENGEPEEEEHLL